MPKKKIAKKSIKRLAKPAPKQTRKAKHVAGKDVPIKLAAILLIITGAISLVTGAFLTLVSSNVSGAILLVGQNFMATDITVFAYGTTAFLLGFLELVIGYALWKMHRWAGYLGALESALAFVFNIPFMFLNPASAVVGLVLSAIVVILIFLGRKSLQGSF
jgi:hypothetical protein